MGDSRLGVFTLDGAYHSLPTSLASLQVHM